MGGKGEIRKIELYTLKSCPLTKYPNLLRCRNRDCLRKELGVNYVRVGVLKWKCNTLLSEVHATSDRKD